MRILNLERWSSLLKGTQLRQGHMACLPRSSNSRQWPIWLRNSDCSKIVQGMGFTPSWACFRNSLPVVTFSWPGCSPSDPSTAPANCVYGGKPWFWFSEQFFCWLVLYLKLPCISYGSSSSCVSGLGRPAHPAIWHVSTGFFPPAWPLSTFLSWVMFFVFAPVLSQYLPLKLLCTEPGKFCFWSPVPMSTTTYTSMNQQLHLSQECLF